MQGFQSGLQSSFGLRVPPTRTCSRLSHVAAGQPDGRRHRLHHQPPLGTLVAMSRFRPHGDHHPDECPMGPPPVVVRLLIYLLLSNRPAGLASTLYTPTAMIVAQAVLITPIVAALSREVIEQLHSEYAEQFPLIERAAGYRALLWDARYSLVDGRAGRVRLRSGGGRRRNHRRRQHRSPDRVMTTGDRVETSKGDLAPALALGIA